MNEISSEKRVLFEEKLTSDIIQRLVAYALSKLKRRYWRGVYKGHVPGGVEAKDLVQEACSLLLSAERVWDPEKQPDLYLHLKNIIDSLISHLVNSAENKRSRSASDIADISQEKDYEDVFSKDESEEPPPQITQIEENECYEFLWGLREFVEEDPLLQKMVDAYIEGFFEPAELAEYCGAKTKEIYNAKKRLMRRYSEYSFKMGHNPLSVHGGK